jgi:hypothetical protein
MDGTGAHHVKLGKPDSERQRSYVFFHMWKIDPNDKCIHKHKHDNMYIYTCLR